MLSPNGDILFAYDELLLNNSTRRKEKHMQGMVFTEFLKMVDEYYSPEITEKVISECKMETNGAYTSVGNYSHTELVSLVVALAKHDTKSVQQLVRAFGNYLLERFSQTYSDFFDEYDDVFDFFDKIGPHVHSEVMKLYPDSSPPSISTKRISEESTQLFYKSHRCLGDAAHGLIEGALEYYATEAIIERNDLNEKDGCFVCFTITKLPRKKH